MGYGYNAEYLATIKPNEAYLVKLTWIHGIFDCEEKAIFVVKDINPENHYDFEVLNDIGDIVHFDDFDTNPALYAIRMLISKLLLDESTKGLRGF